MQSGKRYVDFLGQSPELLGGDVSELALNLPEVFENQVALLAPGGTPSYRTENSALRRALSMIHITNPR
jgi:hypothetical protein